MSINFTINALIITKKFGSENLNKRGENIFDINQFKIFGQQ